MRCAPRHRPRGLRNGVGPSAGAALAGLALALLSAVPAGAFGFAEVVARAEELSRTPFRDPRGQVPDWLTEISYDGWRDIRFRPQVALWRGTRTPFEAQFFHPGLFYDRIVEVHEVSSDGVRPLEFDPGQFHYGANDFESRVPQDLGYAGFRLHYPLKKPDYLDEVIVFLGASYFRAVGRDQVYGLSARGLAIDTALPSGEEFPYFREFWLERPAPGAKAMSFLALLDSRRVTGAYRFVVQPGEQTRVDVELALFARAEVKKVGIGPLTSMFFYGENSLRSFEDFRPEIHDSDGLLLAASTGEWMWRPLDNPSNLQVTSFDLPDPKGFGLIQRDRNFDHYQDLETHAERRPSAWVEPAAPWGPGRAELVEIPTQTDVNDNVVAYWVPAQRLAPGAPLELAYSVYWYGGDPSRPPAGRVEATRRDRGTHPDAHRFVVDFVGRNLEALPADTVLQGVVSIGGGADDGELLEQRVEKNRETGGFRLVFQVRPRGGDPLELRAFLQRGSDALTETWAYLLVP